MSDAPGPGNGYRVAHVDRLCDSFHRLLGHPLIDSANSGEQRAAAIFDAEFVVLSSGLEADPLFNYANRTALGLFELEWAQLVALPARESAEPENQATREQLMQQVREQGYIDNYAGVRISATGRRFVIERATVWNVIDEDGALHGQAATFSQWRVLS